MWYKYLFLRDGSRILGDATVYLLAPNVSMDFRHSEGLNTAHLVRQHGKAETINSFDQISLYLNITIPSFTSHVI